MPTSTLIGEDHSDSRGFRPASRLEAAGSRPGRDRESGFTLPRRATFADALVAVIFAGGLKGNAACARIIHDIIEGQRVVVSEAGMSRMLRERIIEKFDEISKDPRGTDSKKLDDATYRVRVG